MNATSPLVLFEGWLLVLPVIAGFSYLLGSIPFGLVLTRLSGGGDIRTIGSGNIGATNVLRTGNKGLALATLLLDGGKGALAVVIARHFSVPELHLPGAFVAAVFSILGHLYPVWLKYKGGKGVATTMGVLLAFNPLLGLVTCLIWLGTAFAFRYSSLAAIIAVSTSPFTGLLIGGKPAGLLALILAVLVLFKHRENISRLLKGTESKISLGSKKAA